MGPGTQTPYVKSLHQVPPVFVEVVEAVGREMVVKKNTRHTRRRCVSSPLFVVVVVRVLVCNGGPLVVGLDRRLGGRGDGGRWLFVRTGTHRRRDGRGDGGC